MEPAESEPYPIHVGTWTNWSYGRILGVTLTLPRREGDLLIAFFALFVTIVGTSVWRISCFTLHQLYSREAARDGLYHQRQAILRNSANGASGLWSFLQVTWSWRGNSRRLYRRIIPVITLTILLLGLFAAASGFSSRIATTMGNEVLLSAQRCGALDPNAAQNFTGYESSIVAYWSQRLNVYANYAEQCYSNKSDLNSCQTFINKQLKTTVDRNASCPFHGNICSTSSNIRFDTGFLDSHYDLGLNSPPSERYLYRRTTHCGPLRTEGRKKLVYDNETGANLWRYYFGEQLDAPFTYEYPGLSSGDEWGGTTADYTLKPLISITENGTRNWAENEFWPIPEMDYPDSDVMLFFLSPNRIVFLEEINDPWYSAHKYAGQIGNSFAQNDPSAEYLNVYFRDDAASVLGCILQDQFCNPNLPPDKRCVSTATSGYDAVFNLWKDKKAQLRVKSAIEAHFAFVASISSVVEILGVPALTSRYKLAAGMQRALPDNQWQLDVEHWHETSMAYLQGTYIDAATRPSDPEFLPYLVEPKGDDERYFCRNQKIRSTAYTNFSVFYLALVFSLGAVVIILSYTLEQLVATIQRRYNLDKHARLEWCTNETLQLQRLAHEELLGLRGVTWKGCTGGVPVVTERGRLLGVLDLEDLEHPRLKAPLVSFEEEGLAGGGGSWGCGGQESEQKGVVQSARVSEERSLSLNDRDCVSVVSGEGDAQSFRSVRRTDD
ncbi:cytochrome p450 protein [Diplodia corticola]|uniref:Cytochrome p450 protein n=1 Tax=Diplodia corticola TaxID=236234 RepID=A0A1J9QQ50_9PEZI|nr:cytochrome p450 protein [Diplodia corticola]OJD30592.1 cytochrome p450 protein [Diplodia corticola]